MKNPPGRSVAMLAVLAFPILAARAGEDADADAASRTSYVTLSFDADDEDGRQTLAELGLSLGSHAWIGGGLGKTESRVTEGILKTDLASVSFGLNSEHVEFSVGFTDRDAGDAFKQRDWTATLGWRGKRGGFGVNGFDRRSDSETLSSIITRRGNPLAIRVIESLDGSGFGLHGDWDLAPQLNVFALVMDYSYDDPASNHPALSRLLFLNGSGVTRGEAFLDRSYGVGLTYRFVKYSVTGQYIHDEAIENTDAADTFELRALLLAGEHWSLSPSVGYSDSDLQGGIGYAGLALGYNW